MIRMGNIPQSTVVLHAWPSQAVVRCNGQHVLVKARTGAFTEEADLPMIEELIDAVMAAGEAVFQRLDCLYLRGVFIDNTHAWTFMLHLDALYDPHAGEGMPENIEDRLNAVLDCGVGGEQGEIVLLSSVTPRAVSRASDHYSPGDDDYYAEVRGSLGWRA